MAGGEGDARNRDLGARDTESELCKMHTGTCSLLDPGRAP